MNWLNEKEPLSSGGRVAAVRRVNWFGESDLDLKSIIKRIYYEDQSTIARLAMTAFLVIM